MSRRLALVLAVTVGCTGVALAQSGQPPKTPQDFIAILKPSPPSGPTIGRPIGPTIKDRKLNPSTGGSGSGGGQVAASPSAVGQTVAAAGTSGSGRVPDLQILFEFNSAELTGQARERLDTLGAALASDELRPFRFQIAGHTDTVGSPGYNTDLSKRRAEAVVSYLVSRWGIDAARLRPRGFGMSQLIDPKDGASARNRRVEVETIVAN